LCPAVADPNRWNRMGDLASTEGGYSDYKAQGDSRGEIGIKNSHVNWHLGIISNRSLGT